jgi:hypothetical protein
MRQVVLAFFTRPVAGEMVPGMPMPTGALPRAPALSSRRATRVASAERMPG